MAKDLPYFKFRPSEWNDGDITLCSFTAQGLYINLCAMYWSQECKLTLSKAKRRYKKCPEKYWQELIKENVIKVNSDQISIKFLDLQWDERIGISNKNSENAHSRWQKAGFSDAVALPSDSVRTEIAMPIEKKRKEKKRREESVQPSVVALTMDQRDKQFIEALKPYVDRYGKEMIRAFYNYWSQRGEKKMLFETQKIFDIEKRLITWHKNDIKKEEFKQPSGVDAVVYKPGTKLGEE